MGQRRRYVRCCEISARVKAMLFIGESSKLAWMVAGTFGPLSGLLFVCYEKGTAEGNVEDFM